MENRTVELRVPATEDMMLVIRLATSGVLLRAGLTLDNVDDVKMAVEEAANCLVRYSGCGSVEIRYELGAKLLKVTLAGDCCRCGGFPRTPDELATIRYILESMVDSVKLAGRDDGLTHIELCKNLPE